MNWITWPKLMIGIFLTVFLGYLLVTRLQYIQHEWTLISMKQVTDNMGDQLAIQAEMRQKNIEWDLTLLTGLIIIGAIWICLFLRQVKKVPPFLFVALLLTGCQKTNVVIVTPPNYAIVIDLSLPTNQATGNNFGNGELVNLTQVTIIDDFCAYNSNDRCPDKLVAQVQGSPESRIYTQDPNTGTSGANQSLCFEAKGVNGCVDFSVSAQIMREDARCYANKMGVKPVVNTDGTVSRFNFVATPLAEALDTRVIQITSSEFAKATANMSPLTLATEKFSLFEEMKPEIIKTVHERTCITVNDIAINGGIVWSSPAVQEAIDQATIMANKTELANQQNVISQKLADGLIQRTKTYSDIFGLDAALRLAVLEKWDGTYLPFPAQQAPQLVPSSPITQAVPQ